MDKDTIVLCCNAQVDIFVIYHYRLNVFCVMSLRYVWILKSMSSIVESLKHISSKINWLKWGEKRKTKDRKGTRLVTVFCCAWSVDMRAARKSPSTIFPSLREITVYLRNRHEKVPVCQT